MRALWSRVRQPVGPSVAVGVLAAVATAVRLMLPTPVAMANNGDASRLLCSINADTSGARWQYAVIRYRAQTGGQPCLGYPTFQAVPVSVLSWIHRHVLGLSGVLDARELMLVYCVTVGLAIGGFFRLLAELRTGMALRLGFALALFVVLDEATFADYAGSPYTETAALYGLPIFAVGGVALVGGMRPKVALGVAWAGAMLIVGAKTQTATLVIPLALFFLLRRVEVRRLRRRWGTRVLPVLCAASLAVTAFWALGGASGDVPQKDVNVANEITMTIMPLSGDAAGVATDLGMPARFAAYSGTSWWSAQAIEKDPEYPRIAPKMTGGNLASYFASHPAMAAKVFAHGAPSYLSFRNDYIGTYAKGAGFGPGKQEHRLAVVSTFSRWFRWTGITGVVAYWILCLTAAGLLAHRSPRGSLARGFAEVAVVTVVCTVMQYVLSVFGDGNELTKHLAVGLLAATLAPLWIGAGIVVLRRTSGVEVADLEARQGLAEIVG